MIFFRIRTTGSNLTKPIDLQIFELYLKYLCNSIKCCMPLKGFVGLMESQAILIYLIN